MVGASLRHLKLTKGHDFKLSNHPVEEILDISDSKKIVIHPLDFPQIKPKLLIKSGDYVKVGTPLFIDKLSPNINFVSPVSGKINDIIYGDRRSIQSIRIENDDEYSSIDSINEDIMDLDRDLLINCLMKSGLWTSLRQRPFSIIANPDSNPKSLFISLYDTRPYGCSPELLITANKNLFNKGLQLITKITDCPIYINVNSDFNLDLIDNIELYNIHIVSGPHPAGNVGVQIHHIDPILNRDDIRWYIDTNSLIDFGYFVENKSYFPYKIISVCGQDIVNPNYRKIVKNQMLNSILITDTINLDTQRIISGDMLSGLEKDIKDGIGAYDNMITILSTDNKRQFLGWINPGLNKYSLSNAFLSKLSGKLTLQANSRLNGDLRSIISFGRWEKVLPMDIMPEELVKSILIEDLEEMENLGIYECSEEDFALCSYVCQSKTEVSQIIKKGIELAALDS